MSRRAGPRTILITGASSGLGAGLALSYAAPGVRLGIVGRHAGRLAEIAAGCGAAGADVTAIPCDVRDHARLAAAIGAFDEAGPVDLLIAAAGISGGTLAGTLFEDVAPAMDLVQVNLLGAMATVAPLLPRMVARRGGRIALVASVAALRGLPDSPGYCASKAGLCAYGEALRACLQPLGVSVSVIIPGFFESPMTDRFNGPHPMQVDLETAVGRIRRGLDRAAPRIVFPRAMALGLQLANLLPAPIGDWLMRRFRFDYD